MISPQSALCSRESWSQPPAAQLRTGPQNIEKEENQVGNEVNIGSFETLIGLHKVFAYIFMVTVYPPNLK